MDPGAVVAMLSITAGAAGMYCGSCFRDNALARELQSHGIALLGSTIIGLEHHTPDNIGAEIEHAVDGVFDRFHRTRGRHGRRQEKGFSKTMKCCCGRMSRVSRHLKPTACSSRRACSCVIR